MLKFEFDKEKQKIFLDFWKIKKISDFQVLVNNLDLFFLRFCLLNEVALKLLGKILSIKIAEGELEIQRYSLHSQKETHKNKLHTSFYSKTEEEDILSSIKKDKDNQIHIVKEIFEMLDSINIISLWNFPSSSNKKSIYRKDPLTQAKYQEIENIFSQCRLTKEFEYSFKTMAAPPFGGSPKKPKPNIFNELNKNEKRVLLHFLEFYGFTNNRILLHHPEETLLELKKKGLIDFSFLYKNWIPAATVNPYILSLLQEKGDFSKPSLSKKEKINQEEISFIFPKENLVESLFFIQVLKFEQTETSPLQKYYPNSKEKKDFLKNLFEDILEKKKFTFYQELSFSQKILFLIKEFSPKSYSFLQVLISSSFRLDDLSLEKFLNNLQKGLTEQEITYEINRRNFTFNPNEEKNFSQEKVKKILQKWILLGLIYKKNHIYYGEVETLKDIVKENQKLEEKKLEKYQNNRKNFSNFCSGLVDMPHQPNSIVIDSDHTLVATKEKLQAQEIFFLYHFCDLKISSHLIRGQLETEKSSLAWYYNLDAQQLLNFFKSRAALTLKKNFQEILELYFEHTPFFKVYPTIKINTPSKNFFLMLKYFLKENQLLSQTTILEKEKTFIFHDPLTFELVKEKFPDPPPIKIFEED